MLSLNIADAVFQIVISITCIVLAGIFLYRSFKKRYYIRFAIIALLISLDGVFSVFLNGISPVLSSFMYMVSFAVILCVLFYDNTKSAKSALKDDNVNKEVSDTDL